MIRVSFRFSRELQGSPIKPTVIERARSKNEASAFFAGQGAKSRPKLAHADGAPRQGSPAPRPRQQSVTMEFRSTPAISLPERGRRDERPTANFPTED